MRLSPDALFTQAMTDINREVLRYFVLTNRTALSFSGGRTSALMLWLTIQANPLEALREYLQVMFGNTGREDEATLRFIKACTDAWLAPLGLDMKWVEYRNDPQGFAVVDFATASRNGEPFEALIKKRQYLPNPVTRFCTVELKIRAMHKYLRTLGWLEGDDGWDQMVGIRADEQRRVAKMRARGHSTESRKEHMRIPLADAGVNVGHVQAFWEGQPFNLELPTFKGRTLAGNCDLCFLKPAAQVQSLIAEKPARGVWWARMETEVSMNFDSVIGPQPVMVDVWDPEADDGMGDYIPTPMLDAAGAPVMAPPSKTGATFRSDRPSYSQMLSYVADQRDMFAPGDEEPIACFCGD
jgi:3'-phosphoadenosine 5'-phosphosulfate sulfotransferase (PAPS reductase)/FAD synthetase